MEIKQFTWDIVDSNSWLITEEGTEKELTENHHKHGECEQPITHGLLIDVVASPSLYEAISAPTSLASLTIILTHSHFDHIIGLNHLRSLRPDAVVISTARCSENLANIQRNLSSTATAFMAFYEQGSKQDVVIEPFTCDPADKTFITSSASAVPVGSTYSTEFAGKGEKKECREMQFNWHGHDVRLFPVYGHSDDGLLILIDKQYLFSGDTVLSVLLSLVSLAVAKNGMKKRMFRCCKRLLQSVKVMEVARSVRCVKERKVWSFIRDTVKK